MKRRKHYRGKPRKPGALLLSLLIVAAALLYIGFGDKLGVYLEKYGIYYQNTNEVFTKEVTDGELEVHIIDVGQGDGILIRTAKGVMLIDAGPNDAEDAMRAYLDACSITTIDYFVCTHPHEDHIGGADMVLKEYDVDTVMMNETDVSTATVGRLLDALEASDALLEVPTVGEVYTLGDMRFTVLSPQENLNDGGNNSSIVLRLEYGETSFVFTGDAEVEAEEQILAHFAKSALDSDFLKVGHHGSKTSTSEDFLEAVSPTYVAISCAKGNSYGHPHREILNRLAAYGLDDAHILRTDTSGSIVLISDGKTLRVK